MRHYGVKLVLVIFCITEDAKGNIWFGGRYGLLWKYDGNILSDYTYKKLSNT